MTVGHAELLMYPAPEVVHAASERWLARTLELLDAQRLPSTGLDLHALFRSPELLLTQTCGYPLMTTLRGQVRLVGRPDFDLPYSGHGDHHSLLLVRDDQPDTRLETLRGGLGAANSLDSNTGMNLLRHALAPWQQDGAFFGNLELSGSHRQSLAWLRQGRVDLVAVDSVTFGYLALYAPEEVTGVRVLQPSAPSPTLPYITAGDEGQAERIREAMNQALRDEPEVAQLLGIRQVLPAVEADYLVLLDYEREATERGLPQLHAHF
jgi:ABC-type phosphate/phosphonate transport system substrate-binding protein